MIDQHYPKHGGSVWQWVIAPTERKDEVEAKCDDRNRAIIQQFKSARVPQEDEVEQRIAEVEFQAML